MAARPFYLPFQAAVKPNNVGAPGAKYYFYAAGTTTLQTIYSADDLVTPLANPLTADGAGKIVDVWLDDGLSWKLVITDKNGDELYTRDPYVPGTAPDATDLQPYQDAAQSAASSAGTSASEAAASEASARAYLQSLTTLPTQGLGVTAASRAALAMLATTAPAILTESGREGTFVFDSSNLSAKVSADPQQGIYIAPASDTTGASGAWKRMYPVGVVDPRWWGLVVGDAAGANRATNDTAIAGMFTTLLAIGTTITISVLPEIKWPFGIIETSQAITPSATVKMSGHGMGHFGSGPTLVAGTVFRPHNCHGFNLGYTRSSLSDVGIQGNFTDTNTEAEYHGVYATQTPFLTNVKVYNMAGDGFNFNGQSSAGNSTDCGRMIGCEAWCNRDGISLGITGGNGDANVIHVIGGILNQNRRWGINDNGFLGNEFFAVQMATNGCNAINDGVTLGASKCVYNGYSYFAIAGQEAGASTNAPSGSATDNTWWAYKQGTGSDVAASGKPAWSSGMLVRAGGSVHGTSVTAQSTYTGCYAETDQGWAQIVYPAIINGGVLATLVWAGSTGAVLTADSNSALIQKLGPLKSTPYRGTDETFGVQIGERSSSLKTLLFASSSIGAPTGHRLRYINTTTGDLEWSYANSFVAYDITGPNTAQVAGTGAAIPHAFRPSILLVQPYVTTAGQSDSARRFMIDTAAPASGAHGQGEWVMFRGSTAGLIGYKCTSPGTPGTWEAVYSGYSLGQIGYQTGAGGAVPQATSRTTGVTLNKVCGAITLVSAAGSTSWQTFTVTNSQVAATDVIRVVQKSGTDKYMIHVTNVGAGTFDITFATTGGTTTEQPVFNFAVIKAAAA